MPPTARRPDAPPRHPGWRIVLRSVVPYGSVLVATAVATTWSLRLWRAHPRRPWAYGGDALTHLTNIETIVRTGWRLENPYLGWPFGRLKYDFPSGGENLHFLTMKVFSLLTSDAVLIANSFFIFTFLAVGVSTFVVLRLLRFNDWIAGGVAVLYAVLPFHFWHGVPHLSRVGYYAIPFATLVLLWVTGYDGGLLRVGHRRRRLVGMVLTCGVVGSTDTIAAGFTAALFAGAGVAMLLVRRDWRVALLSIAGALLVIGTVVLNNLPSLLYEQRNGTNDLVLQREATEQELYGLKLSAMVLPGPDHPIGALGDLGRRADENTLLPSEGGKYLGLVGLVGIGYFLAVLFAGRSPRRFGGGAGRSGVRPDDTPERGPLVSRSLGLALMAIVLAVPSGLAFIPTILGFEEIRTWNRIVVYIGFVALLLSATLAEQAWAIASRRGWPRWVLPVGVAFVTAVGVWDQTPATPIGHDSMAEQWNADDAFFEVVEASYPAGEIFQLPVIPWPEPGRDESRDWFRQSVGYLHTDDIRFSYGGIRGREWEWQRELERLPPDVVVEVAAAAGFDALLIDRLEYHDRAAALEAYLGDVLPAGPLVSADGRHVVYDLGPLQQELVGSLGPARVEAIADEALHAVRMDFGEGFHTSVRNPRSEGPATARADLEMSNPTDEPVEVVLEIDVTMAADATHLDIVDREGTGRHPVTDGRLDLVQELILPPGPSVVTLATDGSDIAVAGDTRSIALSFRLLRMSRAAVFELVLDANDPSALTARLR